MAHEAFIITVPANLDMKGTALAADIKKFEEHPATIVGLDLSALTVLYSAQIGILIGALKAAKKKSGATVMYVKNEMLFKLLTSLNLHRTADIVRDADEFQRLLKEKTAGVGQLPAAAKPAVPEVEKRAQPQPTPPPPPPAPAAPQSSPRKSKGAVFGFIFALFILIAGVVIAMLLVERQGAQTEITSHKTAIMYLKNTIDSLQNSIAGLTKVITRYEEDLKLMQEMDEISAPAPKASTSPKTPGIPEAKKAKGK